MKMCLNLMEKMNLLFDENESSISNLTNILLNLLNHENRRFSLTSCIENFNPSIKQSSYSHYFPLCTQDNGLFLNLSKNNL